MKDMKTLIEPLDRYYGCILGGAIGDALGAPVEFAKLREIQSKFGAQGVTDMVSWVFPAGYYTDDTQMTLYTIEALFNYDDAIKRQRATSPVKEAHRSYLAWLRLQQDPKQRRAPGATCMSALQSGRMGTIKKRINNSKGCGGVMRTAPVGLAFPTGELAFRYGAEFAAITHGHPSGYLSAGFLSELIFHLAHGTDLQDAILRCRTTLISYPEHEETLASIDRALKLAPGSMTTASAIESIGGGWTGEEALAISLLCALRFQHSFIRGVLAAVNHSGDSDSTGSITGSILGTLLGITSIPKNWVEILENSKHIEICAMDLYKTFVYQVYKAGEPDSPPGLEYSSPVP